MIKSFIVTLVKKTQNCAQYESPIVRTMYIYKSALPNTVPKAMKVTIETEEVISG